MCRKCYVFAFRHRVRCLLFVPVQHVPVGDGTATILPGQRESEAEQNLRHELHQRTAWCPACRWNRWENKTVSYCNSLRNFMFRWKNFLDPCWRSRCPTICCVSLSVLVTGTNGKWNCTKKGCHKIFWSTIYNCNSGLIRIVPSRQEVLDSCCWNRVIGASQI